jgi:hypothetical protein
VIAAEVMAVRADQVTAAVPLREYRRLLGLPRGRAASEELVDRENAARAWYAAHGRPFVAARRVPLREVGDQSATLATGDVLESAVLAERLRVGEAHAVVVLAASAGPEVAREARRLWAEGRPDEGYFLDRLAATVAERLVFHATAAICPWSGDRREWPLPHLSPGCGHWDLTGQHGLMRLLLGLRPGEGACGVPCGPVALLESGMLEPQHSLLAAFGVTHRAYVATAEAACRSCDLDPCDQRRVPHTSEILRPLVFP